MPWTSTPVAAQRQGDPPGADGQLQGPAARSSELGEEGGLGIELLAAPPRVVGVVVVGRDIRTEVVGTHASDPATPLGGTPWDIPWRWGEAGPVG